MPYPRSCPHCSVSYRDDRSHVSLSSQQREGRTVVRLMCVNCRDEYDWDFTAATVFMIQVRQASHLSPSVRTLSD